MSIHIVDIDSENCFDVIELTTNKNGVATIIEEYVCSNAASISEAYCSPYFKPKAIFDADHPIGFFMYEVLDDEPTKAEIYRFMLGHQFTGQGLGKKAFQAIVDYLIEHGFKTIEVMLDNENAIAKKVYTSCGFTFSGKIEDDEYYYHLIV